MGLVYPNLGEVIRGKERIKPREPRRECNVCYPSGRLEIAEPEGPSPNEQELAMKHSYLTAPS
jgi:hypothetical protein